MSALRDKNLMDGSVLHHHLLVKRELIGMVLNAPSVASIVLNAIVLINAQNACLHLTWLMASAFVPQ